MIIYGYVYLIKNVHNDKVYVGVTKRDPKIRWQEHLRDEHNNLLKEDMKTFGETSFTFELIDTAKDCVELSRKEQYWISKFNACNTKFGYNKSIGGCGPVGYSWSVSSKLQASKDRQGSKWFHKGTKHALVRAQNIQQYLDDEWQEGYGPGRVRSAQSDETKQKSGAAHKGKPKVADQIRKQQETLKSKHYHWYTNGEQNLSIPEGDNIPEGFRRGRSITEEQRIKCGIKN